MAKRQAGKKCSNGHLRKHKKITPIRLIRQIETQKNPSTFAEGFFLSET